MTSRVYDIDNQIFRRTMTTPKKDMLPSEEQPKYVVLDFMPFMQHWGKKENQLKLFELIDFKTLFELMLEYPKDCDFDEVVWDYIYNKAIPNPHDQKAFDPNFNHAIAIIDSEIDLLTEQLQSLVDEIDNCVDNKFYRLDRDKYTLESWVDPTTARMIKYDGIDA